MEPEKEPQMTGDDRAAADRWAESNRLAAERAHERREATDAATDEELAAAAAVDDQLAAAADAGETPAIVTELEEIAEAIAEALPPLLDLEDLVGRSVAGQASTIHLEDAMQCWDLQPEDVLAWREVPEQELVLVTAGGRKLRWPDDMDVELTDGARGRPVKPSNRVFPNGYLQRDPEKDPKD